MLIELRLKNLAIAEDVALTFAPGLNVLTGSTGAGKSLVVEALRWLSGARVDRGTVRRGAAMASAEALFDVRRDAHLVRLLDEVGVEWPEDGVIRLRREVHADAPSRAFVGASRTTAAVLSAVCDGLIELQSQHRQLGLLEPTRHVSLLDACGVDTSRVDAYHAAREEFVAAQERLRQWEARLQQVKEQRDILEYQWRELQGADLRGDEMPPLRETVARLAGGAQLLEALAQAEEFLGADDVGSLSRLARAIHALRSVTPPLDRVVDAVELLTSAQVAAEEARAEIGSLLAEDAMDPRALDRAQARLNELESLSRKYARTEDELVSFRERLREELDQLEGADGPPPEIAGPLERAREALASAGASLSRARRTVARRVAREASPLLADLGMPGARLEFELIPRVDPEGPVAWQGTRVDPGPQGLTDVRLRVQTNPGEAMGPVERVASGGELSRIGLVLKTLGLRDGPGLVILDEVDAGMGADLGPAIARRLRAMAASTQTLVISHLPQVAAVADVHLRASKHTRGGRTVSTVTVVEGEDRVTEVARMIGGKDEEARRLARSLVGAAARPSSEEARG